MTKKTKWLFFFWNTVYKQMMIVLNISRRKTSISLRVFVRIWRL